MSYYSLRLKSGYAPYIALTAGLFMVLAFSPFNLQLAAILSPAMLLYAWLYASPKQSFFYGWLFGLGQFGLGFSWVYISLAKFGNMPMLAAGSIVALLISFLALFPAIQGYCFSKLQPQNNPVKLLIGFPCLWVLTEMLRGWIFSGLPWLTLGYSQTNSLLSHYAPVIGIYGVSLILTLIGASFLALLARGSQPKLPISLLVGIYLSAIGLGFITWSTPTGKPLTTSLVQANIPQTIKWTPDMLDNIVNKYNTLTKPHLNSDLIVWPEAALPSTQTLLKPTLAKITDSLKTHKSALITGIIVEKNQHYYNGLIGLGSASGLYLKNHLVPYGEYWPLGQWSEHLLNILNIPMSDFTAGSKHQPLITVKGVPIGTFICYEIAYSEQVLNRMPKAQLLVVASDDSWFGQSIALAQHLQMAQMNAIATARQLLFVSNTGLTAIIDQDGRIVKKVPAFKTQVLSGDVQPLTGATPWTRTGNMPILLLTLLAFILSCFHNRSMLNKKNKQ